jgi:hypothetical protein
MEENKIHKKYLSEKFKGRQSLEELDGRIILKSVLKRT